jgi:predicted nucleic-acid-binding Zn-ribbon protein
MQSGRCPKCSGVRIATSRYALYLGGGVTGPQLALYACADCRYTEQYMVESVENRVAVLDSWSWVQPEKGPFR